MPSSFLKKLKAERAMAMLELAIFSMVLLILVLGGFSVSLFMQKAYSVSAAVDRYVAESAVRPFALNTTNTSDTVNVNTTKLQNYIDDLVTKISADLKARIDDPTLRQGETGYYVEASYAVVNINSTDGTVGTVATQYRKTQGGLTPPASLLQSTDLDSQFDYQAHQTAGISHPSASFGRPGLPQYLNSAVLVGVRAFISMKGAFSGEMYQTLGGEPYIYSTKVVNLRGDVEYE